MIPQVMRVHEASAEEKLDRKSTKSYTLYNTALLNHESSPKQQIAHHMGAKSLSQVVPSILEANVPSLLAIEALGKDTDDTQVYEEADEQRQGRLYAEVGYGLLLSSHLGAVDVPVTK